MKPKLLTIAFVFVLIGAVFVAATATAAKKPVKTTVTIKAQGADLSGVVKSAKKKCMKNRTVFLYKQKGKKQKPKKDTKVASDTAGLQNGKYRWSTGNTGTYGKLYAKLGKAAGCKGGTSKTVRVAQKMVF